MRKLIWLFGLALGVLLCQGPAQAITIFKATLTSGAEVPAIPDEGSGGIGTFVLNDAQTRLSYDVQLFGLDLDGIQTPLNVNDNVTRVHFHRAAVGVNGGIVFGIIDGAAALRNDNNPNDLVVDVLNSRFTGAWDLIEGNPAIPTTLGAELANLFAGLLYFNVHTTDHAGGEIRGQVLAVAEPATILILLGALAGILGLGTKGRRAAA